MRVTEYRTILVLRDINNLYFERRRKSMSVFDKFKDVKPGFWAAIGGAIIAGVVAFAGAMGDYRKEQATKERIDEQGERIIEQEERIARLEKKCEEA